MEVPGLAAGGVEPAFGRDVRAGHDDLPFERNGLHEVQEKTLTRPETAHDETYGGRAVADFLDVLEDGRDLRLAPDLDVM